MLAKEEISYMSKQLVRKLRKKQLNANARLREAFKFWHEAAKSYEDPEGFRIYLNSCIQALRNVTFVLQKQKSEVNNFDNWYSEWQQCLRTDQILSWCVSARNIIVKQGDLDTLSVARASYLCSYNDPPQNDFLVDPFADTESISKEIFNKLPKGLQSSGYLKVERRWVVEDLPDMELLEALAYAYSILSLLVHDAKEQQGPSIIKDIKNSNDVIDKGSFPASMSDILSYRSIYLKLPSLEVESYIMKDKEFKDFSREGAVEKYGKEVIQGFRTDSTKTALFNMASIFKEQAKIMLSVDGYLVTVAMLLGENKIIHMMPLEFADNDQKYIVMQQVACEVERRQVKSVILIGEVWSADIPAEGPMIRASEDPNRKEAIHVLAISNESEEFSFFIPYIKECNHIVYGEEKYDDTINSILLPIKNAWNKGLTKR